MDSASTIKRENEPPITTAEWQRDADALGVDRTHLYRVITGKRKSVRLSIAYQALKKAQARNF